MSQTAHPYSTGTGPQQSWSSGTGAGAGDSSGAGSGIKDRVADAASQVGDAGRETAHDAKEAARDVAHEASERARGLIGRTRIELGEQVATQQQHLASGLRSLGDELGQMAGGTQDPGYASELVQRAGDATGRVADWFDEHEPGAVLREVEDFARRRPGLFIAVAAGAGLLVGRFVRGMRDAPDDDGGHRPASAPPPVAAPAAVPAAAPPAPEVWGAPTAGGEPYVERP
ncbi:hypothetical protein ACFWEJ_05840 [Promicromonospora sp. NPDC060204]|uniref:hypothetical protein n=1 Tax=Promicromonospora sp. NPDC060204 TaxID=3347071 RepID=UPI00364E4048